MIEVKFIILYLINIIRKELYSELICVRSEI